LRAVAPVTKRNGLTVRVAGPLDVDPLTGMAGSRMIEPVQGLVEVSGPPGASIADLAVPLASIIERIGDIDRERSAVAAGDRNVVLDGDHALLLVLTAARKPSLTASEFHDYWLRRHASLALSLLGAAERARFGYVQLHVDAAASAEASVHTGLAAARADGVLLASVDDLEHLPHASIAGFAERIEADEVHFVDHAAAMKGALLQGLRLGPSG
jgi:hypothetical protein